MSSINSIKAAKAARKGTLVEAQVRKVMSEILEKATGLPLHFASVAEFFHEWCPGNLGESAHKTALKYRQISESFLAALGSKAVLSIAAIGPADIRAWRDALQTGGRSPATVNGSVKGIRPLSPIYPNPLRCVVFGNANSRSPPAALCPATWHRPECAFTPPQKGSAPKLPSPPETLALFGA